MNDADLHVVIALSRAPVTKGYPAITPEFLALLQRFRWDVQGVMRKNPRNHVERIPSYLTPFALSKRGKMIWWIGGSAARCVCSPGDFAALLKGRVLRDGSIMAGGEARRLHHANGWAYLVPRVVTDPGEVRRHLVTLSNNVLGFLGQMDELMKQPSTPERRRGVATLLNALDLANQTARYFGLDVKGTAKMKKMLPGGTR